VWATGVSWLETPVRHEGATAWTVVNGDVAREVEWMHRRLQPFVHGRVRVASGPVVTGADHTSRSFDLAAGALAVLRQRPELASVTYEQLGLTGLLLAVPREQLDAFVHSRLGPLLDRPDLLQTLEAWFASGGSRAGVAEAVGLHRNSVGYRLDRIRALLGHDPDEPGVALDLRAALAARAVLAART
jgi:sugar diacid utilization regulator